MPKLNIYLKNFKFLRTELKYLFFISLISVLMIELIFSHFDEKFRNGYEIGQLILKLSYSYLSALLFYYLVVHYKRQDDKRKFYVILNDQFQDLFRIEQNFYCELRAINNREQVDKKDEKMLENILNIAITDNYKSSMQVIIREVTSNLGFKHHTEIFYHQTIKTLSNILDNKLLMEVEGIDLILKLKNTKILSEIAFRIDKKLYCKGWAKYLVAYFICMDELREYKSAEIDKYLE